MLTWPDLTWPDLTWPDPEWPDVLPYLPSCLLSPKLRSDQRWNKNQNTTMKGMIALQWVSDPRLYWGQMATFSGSYSIMSVRTYEQDNSSGIQENKRFNYQKNCFQVRIDPAVLATHPRVPVMVNTSQNVGCYTPKVVNDGYTPQGLSAMVINIRFCGYIPQVVSCD